MTARTDAGMHYFVLLNADEQTEAIRKLARSGLGDYSIASATGLAVEQIRSILQQDPAKSAAPIGCERCQE